MPMLDVGGASLYFSVIGKGEPLVFIHPPVLSSNVFQYQVKELSHLFQVITFDIRGHGRSTYSNLPITYPLIVEDIKKILDHLKINKTYLCGYSTGGSIVLEYLLTSSERANGGIIVSGMSEVNDKKLKRLIKIGAKLARIGAVTPVALSISKGNSNTLKEFQSLYKEAKKANKKNIEQYFQYSLNYNTTLQLGNIHLPTLLIYGEKDEEFSTYAKILHDHLPVTELTFIENVSHQIPYKAPKELNKRISQFIKNQTDKK